LRNKNNCSSAINFCWDPSILKLANLIKNKSLMIFNANNANGYRIKHMDQSKTCRLSHFKIEKNTNQNSISLYFK